MERWKDILQRELENTYYGKFNNINCTTIGVMCVILIGNNLEHIIYDCRIGKSNPAVVFCQFHISLVYIMSKEGVRSGVNNIRT